MSRVIPILPCLGIDEQCGFYESIGFTTTAKYTAPNAYAVVQFDDIVLHFWGSKKHAPEHNASMVFVEVSDVDAVNDSFCASIKKATGKIPRSGFGRISKVRALKEDRRFTLCDPSGNTIYFATPAEAPPARTLEHEEYAKVFGAVYDLLYSHESPQRAKKALPAIMRHRDKLSPNDREKLDDLAKEIEKAQTAPMIEPVPKRGEEERI